MCDPILFAPLTMKELFALFLFIHLSEWKVHAYKKKPHLKGTKIFGEKNKEEKKITFFFSLLP